MTSFYFLQVDEISIGTLVWGVPVEVHKKAQLFAPLTTEPISPDLIFLTVVLPRGNHGHGVKFNSRSLIAMVVGETRNWSASDLK